MTDEVRDREHEKAMLRGLTYLTDLRAWYQSQQDTKEYKKSLKRERATGEYTARLIVEASKTRGEG